MPVPGLSLLGLKRIRGFVSILRYINPTIIIIIKCIMKKPCMGIICLYDEIQFILDHKKSIHLVALHRKACGQ